MEDFTPAECDGKCQICPYDDKCDHIRLTKSQKDCVCASVCIIFFFVIAYMGVLIVRLWQ